MAARSELVLGCPLLCRYIVVRDIWILLGLIVVKSYLQDYNWELAVFGRHSTELSGAPQRTVRALENIERVREALVRSPS